MAPNTYTVEFKPAQPKIKKYIPLLLAVIVIIADQITKALVVKNIPLWLSQFPNASTKFPSHCACLQPWHCL